MEAGEAGTALLLFVNLFLLLLGYYVLGDVLQACVVFAGTTWLALGAREFAIVNVVLIAAWLAVALLLLREYGRIMRMRVEVTAGL